MATDRVSWIPLESNPQMLAKVSIHPIHPSTSPHRLSARHSLVHRVLDRNQFAYSLGVKESSGFHDVWTLDEDALSMVPTPVHALLLLYPHSKVSRSLSFSLRALAIVLRLEPPS